MNSVHLSIATVIYLLFLIIVLLFPFDFSNPTVRTDVSWLTDAKGIEISSTSIISTEKPPQRLYDALVSGDGITLEIWLAAKDVWQDGPARIISYSYDKNLRNFTLGQAGAHLVMRLRTTQTNHNGTPALVVKNVFIPNMRQHIVVTYDFSREMVYINGENRITSKMHRGRLLNWDSSYLFLLGNEATGNRTWLGRIYRVAIYNHALSHKEVLQIYESGIDNTTLYSLGNDMLENLVALYRFDERSGNTILDKSGLKPPLDLHIPRTLKVADKTFLRFSYKDFNFNMGNIRDLIVNIAIFIPLGFLMHNLFKMLFAPSLIITVAIVIFGFLFSLSVESLQFYVMSRSSSMTDVINNTIGILLGIQTSKLRI